MRGCRGLVQAGSEEEQTLTQARFLLWPPENPVPSHSAMSLGGTGSAGQTGKGKAVGVGKRDQGSERGLAQSRSGTPGLDQHPRPGQLPGGWGRTSKACPFQILRTAFLSLPPIPSCSPLPPGGALARARPPGPHVGTTA